MVAGFVYTTMVLGQPAGLSKSVCLYAGADWLRLVCQSEGGRGQISCALVLLGNCRSAGYKLHAHCQGDFFCSLSRNCWCTGFKIHVHCTRYVPWLARELSVYWLLIECTLHTRFVLFSKCMCIVRVMCSSLFGKNWFTGY